MFMKQQLSFSKANERDQAMELRMSRYPKEE